MAAAAFVRMAIMARGIEGWAGLRNSRKRSCKSAVLLQAQELPAASRPSVRARRGVLVLERGEERVELLDGEAALAAGRAVAAQVAAVRPAADGRQRHAEVPRGLGRGEAQTGVRAVHRGHAPRFGTDAVVRKLPARFAEVRR